MEYLVTMTTHVPVGTPEQTIDDVRGRESIRSHELAVLGHLVRLWRPPLRPGEWRTLGLFVAEDDGLLDEVLRSMPLRIWRSDQVTRLTPHPNDPASISGGDRKTPHQESGAEFLTSITIAVPNGSTDQTAHHNMVLAAQRANELAEQGYLLRLWTLPGEGRTLGLWQARDDSEMQAILESLPQFPWMTVETTAAHAPPE